MEQRYFEIGERHVDSITSIKGMPVLSVYSASKAAIRSFALTWSVDLKQRQIRVNAISPRTSRLQGTTSLGSALLKWTHSADFRAIRDRRGCQPGGLSHEM